MHDEGAFNPAETFAAQTLIAVRRFQMEQAGDPEAKAEAWFWKHLYEIELLSNDLEGAAGKARCALDEYKGTHAKKRARLQRELAEAETRLDKAYNTAEAFELRDAEAERSRRFGELDHNCSTEELLASPAFARVKEAGDAARAIRRRMHDRLLGL